MSGLFEARLMVHLADHVRKYRGITRLTTGNTVAQAEVLLDLAQAKDIPAESSTLLDAAFNLWLKGGDPGPTTLDAFWAAHTEHQFRPSKFRLHIGAPACCTDDGDSTYFLRVSDAKCMHRGGTLDQMAMGDFKGEQGRFPDDVVLWWEGNLGDDQVTRIAKLVQPGCTLTLMRPDTKSIWLKWAGIKYDDKLPMLLYATYNLTKVFVSKENSCEITILGVEGLRK